MTHSTTSVQGANLNPKYGIPASVQVLWITSQKKGSNYEVLAGNSEVPGGLLVNCDYQPLTMVHHHDL